MRRQLFDDVRRLFRQAHREDRRRRAFGLFRRRIKPLVKRRTKELVAAELPAKQVRVLDIELPPRHRALYNKRLQRERQKVLGLLDDMQRRTKCVVDRPWDCCDGCDCRGRALT